MTFRSNRKRAHHGKINEFWLFFYLPIHG